MEELFNHYMDMITKPCVGGGRSDLARPKSLLVFMCLCLYAFALFPSKNPLYLLAPKLLLYESKVVVRNSWFVARASLF